MQINGKYYISIKKNSNNIFVTNLVTGSGEEYSQTSPEFMYLKAIYNICRDTKSDVDKKNNQLQTILSNSFRLSVEEVKERLFDGDTSTKSNTANNANTSPKSLTPSQLRAICSKIINFFSEFDYRPSYRFINTFTLSQQKSEYVTNYFRIMDHPRADEISEKVKSAEFSAICRELAKCTPSNTINKRLDIYFGDPGAGKTTLANKLCTKCVVCSSEMLPDALMQNFDFDEGKAKFKPSDLWIAMEKGETILLDEMNMLPYESLKFLQGITDNKEEISFKGYNIKIHPDFKIIGTMNLRTAQGCIPLSDALADRAAVIKEFVLTPDDLISAIS